MPPHGHLIARLGLEIERIVSEVARDVGEPPDHARPAVERYVEMLAASDELRGPDLDELRAVGAAAAHDGMPIQRVLDRYLSTGWVLWGAATSGSDDPDAAAVSRVAADERSAVLASLGAALLRAGDAAAAAIAAGHSAAERDMAARNASALREFIDEALDTPGGDPAAVARITRRALHFGLAAAAPYRVVVVDLGHEIDDEGSEVGRVAAALAVPPRSSRSGERHAGSADLTGAGGRIARVPRSSTIVASKRGWLVVLAAADRPEIDRLSTVLGEVAAGDAWTAVRGPEVPRFADVAMSYAVAAGALSIAERLGVGRPSAGPQVRGLRIVDAADLALEQALLADEVRLRAAVAHELAPLLAAPRIGADLVATLDAYLDSGQNLRATARAMGIAPRTVAYRLGRAEALLGMTLDGDVMRRMGVALFAAALLDRH